MKHYITLLVASLALAACTQAPVDPTPPAVRVAQVPAQWREVDRQIIAYGTAMPSAGGAYTVSRAVDGQVVAVTVVPGERVTRGQALLVFELSAAAKGALDQAAAARTAASREQGRVNRLLADQLASQDQKAQADKAVQDAAAAVRTASADAGGGVRQQIVAPFDGIVATVPASPGLRVSAGTALVTLARQDALIVQAGVEPAERGRIEVGQAVELAALDGSGHLRGTVTHAGQAINDVTRLVDVDVSASGPLLKGQAYQATVLAGRVAGWQVPAEAVQEDADGPYLFQTKGNHAIRVSVSRAAVLPEGRVLVTGALDGKRPVVTAGAYQLSDGATVRTEEAR
ncbi:efflux RND transporter periplasmic adaptor subunit [Stenotrophomonas sp. PD6]|uniref:efflux RND transporter periplasmic adaptor subunit n=1 Tax=Stenotrophomonas sp. PD6 TaxID=3368612 RepID=UPI003B9DDE95